MSEEVCRTQCITGGGLGLCEYTSYVFRCTLAEMTKHRQFWSKINHQRIKMGRFHFCSTIRKFQLSATKQIYPPRYIRIQSVEVEMEPGKDIV